MALETNRLCLIDWRRTFDLRFSLQLIKITRRMTNAKCRLEATVTCHKTCSGGFGFGVSLTTTIIFGFARQDS